MRRLSMRKIREVLRLRHECGFDAKVRFALTGTPVENHIGDLYSISLPPAGPGWYLADRSARRE
jgi:hypothetical protein